MYKPASEIPLLLMGVLGSGCGAKLTEPAAVVDAAVVDGAVVDADVVDAAVADAAVVDGAEPAPKTTRYIRPPTACPHNGDGTAYSCATSEGAHGAFNTWSTSATWFPAGTLLRVDGDWNVSDLIAFSSSGIAASWTRITSYNPAEPALLKGDRPDLLYIYASYVELDHFRIENTDVDGGCVILGHGPSTNHDVNMHDMTLDCATGADLRTIEDVVVANNEVNDVGSPTDNLQHCIYTSEGAKRIDVYRNRCVARANVYSSYCLHVYHSESPGPASEVKFHDNVCEGFTIGAGIYSGATDIQVYGNTFLVRAAAGSSGYGFVCGGAAGVFANNIVLGTTAEAADLQSSSCMFTIDNNAYFKTNGTFVFGSKPGVNQTWAEWQAAGFDVHGILGDPKLVDPSTGDVHLQATSPVRGKGTNTYASSVDFYGAMRVKHGNVDIGAAEY